MSRLGVQVASRAVPLAGMAAILVLTSRLCVACLEIGEAEQATGGGAGTGGSTVGDAPWGSGGASDGSPESATGGGGTGGGFVASPCDSCGTPGGCECVPEVAQGWSYARIADGEQTKCPGSEKPLLVGSGAVDTGCGGCNCGPLSGGECGFALVTYSNSYCGGTGYYGYVYPDAGKCVTYSGTSTGIKVGAFGVGGSCDTGTAPPKPAKFADPKSVCSQTSGGSCGTVGACVPSAAAPYDAKACVVFDSQGVDVACPPGYPNKLSYSTGFDDSRACDCACKPSISCSGGSAVSGCDGGTTQVEYQCIDGTQPGSVQVVTPPSMNNSGCAPDGPSSPKSGSVVASGLRVVCCR